MSPFRHHMIKEQLGQVLIQRGLISPEQLKQALEVQKKEGKLLGETLIKLGFTTEEDITQALAMQHDFPYLPLANYEVDPEVARLIPESLAKEHHVLPIDKMGDILTVVMANPLEAKVIEQIESLTKCKTEIFVATYTEIAECIKRCYNQEKPEEGGETKNG